jgi:hypothetical protein
MLKDLSTITVHKPIVTPQGLPDTRIPESSIEKLNATLGKHGFHIGEHTSHAITDGDRAEKVTNYAIIPNQYFLYACFVYEFATELYKYIEIFDKIKSHGSKLLGSHEKIRSSISSSQDIKQHFSDEDDIALFSKFLDSENREYRFNAKNFINKEGKPRGPKDCFGSIILTQVNVPNASSSILGGLIYHICQYNELFQELRGLLHKQDSPQSNILLEDKKYGIFAFKVIKHITSKKLHDQIFTFLEKNSEDHTNYSIKHEQGSLTSLFRIESEKLSREQLLMGNKPRYYEDPIQIDSNFYYLSTEWTYKKQSRLDLDTFMKVFNSIYSDFTIIEEGNIFKLIESSTKKSLYSIALPKPFILLAGISGTGKSRFVRTQAKMAYGDLSNDFPPNFHLVPVRPDWHEPSDLLGYISRIDGERYVVTDFLSFMLKAWLAATDTKANTLPPDQIIPYWLCLDEMNLAPVEQYFADYLSVIETRKWDGANYSCSPIIKPDLFRNIEEKAGKKLFVDLFGGNVTLGDGSKEDKLWTRFMEKGIEIPPNLIVAGTVNMDETTHGFSRKVIDRALTLDFQEFFPNNFQAFIDGGQIEPKSLGFPFVSEGASADCPSLDDGGDSRQLTADFLKGLNEILENTPFELAYRALNECLISVSCFDPNTMEDLEAVWDDFMMQKVLPRIEGDVAKLRAKPEQKTDAGLKTESYGKDTVLHAIHQRLGESEFKEIWDGESRPDLLRDTEAPIACRSRKKLEWMMMRLKANHFTDFWC